MGVNQLAVEFMYLMFTCMSGESYRMRFSSLEVCVCVCVCACVRACVRVCLKYISIGAAYLHVVSMIIVRSI